MIEEIYTKGEYIQNNPTWHIEDSLWKATQILKIIKKNNLQLASVGDIGCGAGEVIKQLHSQLPRHINFVGYEISPQAFEICTTKSTERLEFKLKNILTEENLIFLDLLLCIDVLEHLEDCWGFLKGIKDKAFYKLFHIPLDISVSSVLRTTPILKARHQVGHIHYFTKETALATLKDTNYEILDYFYTAGSIELCSNSNAFAKYIRQILYTLDQDLAVRLMGGYSLLVLAK
jgi:SAM-dependent methyltransferase